MTNSRPSNAGLIPGGQPDSRLAEGDGFFPVGLLRYWRGRENSMNYFQFHIGDYEKATAHLTAAEDGLPDVPAGDGAARGGNRLT